MEKQLNYSMADALILHRTRKIKNQFFNQVDTLIDWRPVEKLINKYYKKTSSAVGRPEYKGMIKMHVQNVIESLAYNLYRSPGIVMLNASKS